LIAFACFISCIVIIAAANKIDKMEVKFYKEQNCFVDYIQEEIINFHDIYMSLHERLIVFIALTLIQDIYEGLLYPGLKVYDKWQQAKYKGNVGFMGRANVDVAAIPSAAVIETKVVMNQQVVMGPGDFPPQLLTMLPNTSVQMQ